MKTYHYYRPIWVVVMALLTWTARAQLVINYQLPDSTQATYEDSQFDITKTAGSYEFNGLDISKVNYITRFKTANTKEGHVTLPEGAPMEVGTLTVLGGLNNVPVNWLGYFSIPANHITVQNSKGELVYIAVISMDEDQQLSIEVNSLETALSMLLPIFTNPALGVSDRVLLQIKKLVAELPATQALADAIDQSIVKYGYLNMDDVSPFYGEAVDQLVAEADLDNAINEVVESRAKSRTRHSALRAKARYGEPQRVGDLVFELTKEPEFVKIDLRDDIVKADREGIDAYKMTMRIYNTNRFAYTAIMEGRNVNGVIKPVHNGFWKQVQYIVPPQRVSNFVETFTTLKGIAEMLRDSYDYVSGGIFNFENLADMHFADTKLEDVELYVTTSDDVILIQGPIGNTNVMLYNSFRILFSEVLSMLSEKAKGDDDVETFTSKFLEDLAGDDDFMKAFTDIANSGDTRSAINIAIFKLIFPKLIDAMVTKIDLFFDGVFETTFTLMAPKFAEELKSKELLLLKQVEKWGDRVMALFGMYEDGTYLEYHGLDALPPAVKVEEQFKHDRIETRSVRINQSGEGTLIIMHGDDQIQPGTRVNMSSRDDDVFLIKATPAEGWLLGCIQEKWLGQDRYIYDDRLRYDNSRGVYVLHYGENYCFNDDITVYFRIIENETLTYSSGRNGTLTASHWGKPLKSGDEVADTAVVTFTAKPDRGYRLKNWVMGGRVWKAGLVMQTQIDWREIKAEFEEDPDYDYTKDPDYDPTKTDHLAVESKIADGVINKGSTGTIIITSGSGLYKAKSSNEIAFTTELRDNVVTVYAVRDGHHETITITDLVTGEEKTVSVSSVKQGLEISVNTLEIFEGETKTINITKGSGSYQIINGSDQYAKAEVSSNAIHIEGLQKGQSTITLKDVYLSASVNINVSVKESNLKLGAKSISMGIGSSTRVSILKGSGDYSVQSSINTILASMDGNNIVISANGKESGYVTVTDNETQAKQTISVTVNVKDGTIFSSINEDGILICYEVISVEDMTCRVYNDFSTYYYADESHSFYEASTITIPEVVNGFTVTAIGRSVFHFLEKLKRVNLPNTIVTIEAEAFFRCGLISIDIPNSVKEIGRDAFLDCKDLVTVTLPNNITSLNSVFNGCTSLKSIEIPNSIVSLNGTFKGCTSLKSIIIPSSVVSLNNTFGNCTSLEEVVLSNGIKNIGGGTFAGCSNLTSITLPSSIEYIYPTYYGGAFKNCKNLRKFVIHCPLGDSYLPGDIVDIVIGDEVLEIPNYTFYGFENLKSITIGKGVKTIGKGAFQKCKSLTSVVLPEGVESIRDYAFSGCPSLSVVTSEIKKPFFIEGNVFRLCPVDTLYVPVGTKKLYRQTEGWNVFKNIIEIGSSELSPFELSASEASLVAGVADYKVEITSGNDSYTVSSSDESVATAKIEESDGKTYVVITALKAGKATITVTDEESSEKKEIQVEVHTPGELYMIVNHQSSPVEIGLSGHPHVTYTGNQLKIQTPDRTYSFSVNEVNGISFGKKTTNQ